jgi:predicted RNA methylase
MLPLGPLSDAAGRDVILGREHADAALAYCRAMGAKFGAPGYLRYLYGLPVDEALRSGYQMTQRSLRETTPHACAQEIARIAGELLAESGGGDAGDSDRSVLDVFAGIGQMTWSYATAGSRVQAVEKDGTTAGVAVHNMALAGLSGAAAYQVGDGPGVLAAAAAAGQRFSVVHLDPPWRGTYQYDLGRPFLLEDLAFDVADLVSQGLGVAPVVVLSLPHNALASEVGELAGRTGSRALVQYLYIADFPASFSQAPAFFFCQSAAGEAGAACQQRTQHLTIEGKRAGPAVS